MKTTQTKGDSASEQQYKYMQTIQIILAASLILMLLGYIILENINPTKPSLTRGLEDPVYQWIMYMKEE